MITATPIRKADAAVRYFGRELGTSDYYLAEKGLWYGKGARGYPNRGRRASQRSCSRLD
jgi:hypothetical protein